LIGSGFFYPGQNSWRIFETTRGIAVNQPIMDNQTLCQQITRPVINISVINRSKITVKQHINSWVKDYNLKDNHIDGFTFTWSINRSGGWQG